MKRNNIAAAMIVISTFSLYTPVFSGPLEDYLSIVREYDKGRMLPDEQAVKIETTLIRRENVLTDQILNSPPQVLLLSKKVSTLDPDMVARLGTKTKYKIVNEQRTDLKFLMDRIDNEERIKSPKTQKWQLKPVECKGHILDLNLGHWEDTPDKKKQWHSDQFSDVILPQAEFEDLWKKAYVAN
ncbi:MAG: hypothetical protein HQM08_16420 [Candidatus Riflebacteria bacterium]|nr:hypothetical protein [Candidatus Riflebacteria bacterium]